MPGFYLKTGEHDTEGMRLWGGCPYLSSPPELPLGSSHTSQLRVPKRVGWSGDSDGCPRPVTSFLETPDQLQALGQTQGKSSVPLLRVMQDKKQPFFSFVRSVSRFLHFQGCSLWVENTSFLL